jgi:hypothetical protein
MDGTNRSSAILTAEVRSQEHSASRIFVFMLSRSTIIAALAKLETHDFIRAATLGGSDATGRADDLSDVDLFVLVAPDTSGTQGGSTRAGASHGGHGGAGPGAGGSIERAAAAIEDVLRSLSPIRIAYRLPMRTWHGFHQAFYQLADAPEHLMIDWVIVEVGTPHPWFEVERHGTHRVLFDKDNLVKRAHVDRAAIARTIEKRVADLRQKFALFRHLAPKLADRNLPPDAAYFYQALVLRPVVDMLRITHCPDRHDFGFRYLRDDLPRPEYDAICRWCYPASAADIPIFTREVSAKMETLLATWDARRRGL